MRTAPHSPSIADRREPACVWRSTLKLGPRRLRIQLWIAAAFLLLRVMVACSVQSGPTTTPSAIPPIKPLESPTVQPTQAATIKPTATPSQPPTPKPMSTPSKQPSPTPTETTVTRDPGVYVPAMRPECVDDLTTIGPLSQYRIQVTIDPEKARVIGHQAVRYANTKATAQDAIYFRLYPNLPNYGGEIRVASLRVDNVPVEGTLGVFGTALRVPLLEPLPAGREVEIALDFTVSVPVTVGNGYAQFVYAQDVMALANFFPLIPAYDQQNCDRFGNCDDGWNIEYPVPYGDVGFSDSALFDVSVTAPEGWTVVATGSSVGLETAPDGQVTWHMVTGPVRDFNVVLSPRFQRLQQTVDGIVVNSYFLPEDTAGGERVLSWTTDALAFFGKHFGPYPFAELDVVATPTTAGGIEYPGLIVMPLRSYGMEAGFFQLATVHEVAHQWWYSLVGNDQQDEPWLDEALSQYSTALYFEFGLGWGEAGEKMFEPWYASVRGTDMDGAIDLPVAAYTESEYGALVYGKGPLFFLALRKTVGDDLFWSILQAYFTTYRYHIASGLDFVALAEQVSGGDLSALVQEWLVAGQ